MSNDREFVAYVDDRLEMATEPDMATAIDKPHEVMADHFMIPLDAALKIIAWHEKEVERAVMENMAARVLAKVIAILIEPTKNLRCRVWGLAFSFGLAARMNGIRNASDVAKRLGLSRALISYYKREWDESLGSDVEVFGKSSTARERMSQARLEFVRTGVRKAKREVRPDEEAA